MPLELFWWGSDFPHSVGTFPHSRKYIEETFADLSPRAAPHAAPRQRGRAPAPRPRRRHHRDARRLGARLDRREEGRAPRPAASRLLRRLLATSSAGSTCRPSPIANAQVGRRSAARRCAVREPLVAGQCHDRPRRLARCRRPRRNALGADRARSTASTTHSVASTPPRRSRVRCSRGRGRRRRAGRAIALHIVGTMTVNVRPGGARSCRRPGPRGLADVRRDPRLARSGIWVERRSNSVQVAVDSVPSARARVSATSSPNCSARRRTCRPSLISSITTHPSTPAHGRTSGQALGPNRSNRARSAGDAEVDEQVADRVGERRRAAHVDGRRRRAGAGRRRRR